MRSPLVAAAVAVATACALAFGVPLAVMSVRLAGSAAYPALAVIIGVAAMLIGGAAYLGRRLGLRYVEAAAEHVDAERELAADLSHRLRTPLTALRLDADSLPDGPARGRMRAAIEALDSEIDAIIAAARTPVTERAEQAADLVEVVADRLAFWAVLAEDHGRPWEVVGGETPVYVEVPAADLIGAVDALIGNVFQHTPQGTAFRLTVGPAGLVVDDAGDGIADVPSALRRGASGAGSTGLGLDIVRRVATLAGGSLAVARSDLGGARVTLSLPR
ncbi:MAG: HAMP domain-containing histidine kinase [Hamadaea sp.]|nr:HAMP domain-containing sensor histidine kinase [Hamadaea sp.]NUT23165.1 HAMP domain-containing histidine kinase [Hamadaea sp.]